MRTSKIAFALIAALFSATVMACDDDDDDDFDDDVDEEIDEGGGGGGGGTPGVIEWRADLVATELYTTINGDALVQQNEGEAAFTASISVREDVPGSVRPWHVHFGPCGAGGAIVGTDAAYPRLGVGNDGFATSAVQIRVGLDPAAAYSVNVHYSDAMFTRIIACGDLVLQ